ncbi:O-antigen ligase family protein [Paenibacillus sp. YN15]|uniref:O-antigen ligase family protein n=1 Tax=Paenibacillus sp. YN15 TaxID=1742774 RepID=UPI0015EBADCD|nr:O-antigen ligase family protein [Paenibacillus sp. YN15]
MLSRPKGKNKNAADSNQIPIFSIGILLMISILLYYSAFHTALFNGYSINFDKPINTATMLSSITLIMLAIYFFFKWKLEDNRDLISVYVWLIPLTFWISSIAAASPDLAKGMTHIHMMYITLFIAGAYLSRRELGAEVLQVSITVVGYLVTFYGLACAFGNMYSQDAVMFDQGLRLTSVFQYANAYAAFLMATLLCSLYYTTHSRKWYVIFVNGFMIVPILLSFWLTLSRGGIVVMPFIFLAILPLMTMSKQLMLTLYTMIGVVASFPITGYVTNKSTQIVNQLLTTVSPDRKSAETLSWFNGDSLSGWAAVLGVSLIAGGLIWLLQTFVFIKLDQRLTTYSSRKRSRLLLPAVLVIGGALGAVLLLATPVKSLLPDNLETRLENINFQQHSVLERGTFYKDSIKLFKDYPIIGAGGGGWAVLYEKYQNNPYTSRQAHNFFLQYLNEVGILGLAVFVGLLVLVYFLFIRKSFSSEKGQTDKHLIFYMVTISILIHSILDFELSYVFLGSLVFLCLGGMTSILNSKPKWLNKYSALSSKRFIYPAAISILALVFFVFSAIKINANSSYEKAIAYAQQGRSFNEVMAQLDSAIKANPKPDYYALKYDFFMQVASQSKDQQQQQQFLDQAASTLIKARENEPNNRLLLERQYSLFMTQQDYASSIQLLQEALVKYPWELSFYERAASIYNTQWNQAKQANDKVKMDQAWAAIQEIYDKVQQGIDHIATLPKEQMSGRPFYHSSIIRYSVGQVNMINGEYEKAWLQLQPAGEEAYGLLESINPQADPASFEQNRMIVHWYLALAKKQGNLDQNRYNTFIGKYPDSKVQIDNIVSSLK